MEKAIQSPDVNFSQPPTHLFLVQPALWVCFVDDIGWKCFFWESNSLENPWVEVLAILGFQELQ